MREKLKTEKTSNFTKSVKFVFIAVLNTKKIKRIIPKIKFRAKINGIQYLFIS